MNEKYEIIKKFAEAYSETPDKFIEIIESRVKESTIEEKAELFFGIAKVMFNLSYLTLAEASTNKAIEYFLVKNNKKGVARCHTLLGVSHDARGYYKIAIKYYNRALDVAIKTDDSKGKLSSYANLGIAFTAKGEYRKAIEYSNEALDIAIEIDNKLSEASIYSNLGNIYTHLDNDKKANDSYSKAWNIAKKNDDSLLKLKCKGNFASIFINKKDYKSAIKHFEEALDIAKEIKNDAVKSIIYSNLGTIYKEQGNYEIAIEHHSKALDIAREMSNDREESVLLANLGVTYEAKGDYEDAIKSYWGALRISKKIGQINDLRIITSNLAFLYKEKFNKFRLAYIYCKKSIELLEIISEGLLEEGQKIQFTSKISNIYEYIVPLCLKLDKKSEAFEFIERGKSRAFLASLASTEIRPSVQLTTDLKSLLIEEEMHLAKIHEIQSSHLRKNSTTLELGEIDKILKRLYLIYKKMEKLDPEYVFIRSGKPSSLSKIINTILRKKINSVLIEYFVSGNKLYIFLISSRDKKMHLEIVSGLNKKYKQYVENYYESVVKHSKSKNIADDWLGLSEYLIEPVSKYLTKGDLIYFIPYSSLHYLPLHALKLNGERVINNHPVSYLPSASLINYCQNKGSGKLESCASFGVGFEEEAKEIAELFGERPYLGNLATKEKVIEVCSNKDVIHFSCHGYFNPKFPLSSGIELYNKEYLTAAEIFNLKLNTELVTLSACDTGINERNPGDELIGITRAFIYAGTPSVIVSLWPVNRHSTQDLMIEFYSLLKSGLNKATALQKAQIKIMESKEYSHIFYWAPFILVGDWD